MLPAEREERQHGLHRHIEGGSQIVTRKEVAARAGVSEATVSRVFSGAGLVKEETRAKVLAAAKELNYVPNVMAQRFALGKSGNLGVLLPQVPHGRHFTSYYFSEILNGIGAAVREKGYDLLLLFRTEEENLSYAHYFETRKIDACVILGARNVPNELKALQELKQKQMPFCLVNQHFPGEDFNEIDADHVKGSYEAVSFLIQRGYRRIAFLNGPLHYSNSLDRLKGYQEALHDHGIAYDPNLVFSGNYSRTSGLQASQLIYEQKSRIDAVFAANDRMAAGLVQGLQARGVEIGKPFPVVGCDDADIASICNPPLTTVKVPFYEMGYKAAIKSMELAEEGASGPAVREWMPTVLVIRKSAY